MKRPLILLVALAGCADILGIRDPVEDMVIDAPPGTIDGPPEPIDAAVIFDAREQVDAVPVIDAAPRIDARVCGWDYEPFNIDTCGLPNSNGNLDIESATLNTNNNVLSRSPGGDVILVASAPIPQSGATCAFKVYVFDTGTIEGTLRVVGTCPAALVFLGNLTLKGTAGTIDVSATTDGLGVSSPGVGADDAMACGPTGRGGGGGNGALIPLGGGGGGGGGGFGDQGGAGGKGSGASAGNGVPGSAGQPNAGTTLRGGCSGGAGGSGDVNAGTRGAAGGAIHIAVRNQMKLEDGTQIRASGAGGQGARSISALLVGTGGGGGGSGGLILLEAKNVEAHGVAICANGGGGGEGGPPGGLGGGTDGQSGLCATTVALGGAGMQANGGDGGFGGARVQPGGEPGAAANGGGGGGGGGVGRIIIRSPNAVDTSEATISPSP